MDPNQSAAFKSLEQAQQALKNGDKNTARQFAAQAAQLAPELEEVWLMMGALSSSRGSVAYLEKALHINPQSERAKKGLNWALARLQKEAASQAQINQPAHQEAAAFAQPLTQELQTEPTVIQESQFSSPKTIAVAGEEPQLQVRETVPASILEPEETVAPTQPIPVLIPTQNDKTVARLNVSYLSLLVIILCLVSAWVVWQVGAGSFTAFITSNAFAGTASGPAWAHVSMAPANDSPSTPEMTVSPADSPEGISTATSIPEGSLTPLAISSTATPEDTALPSPTQPGSVPTDTAPAPTQIVSSPTQFVPAPTQTFPPAPSATLVWPPNTSPAPIFTALPSATAFAAATLDTSVTEAPSPTPLPTDTGAPLQPTQFAGATPIPGNADVGGSGHWIDVDLTQQMVYAYDGNTLINSFLVSTGTWEHPTVTGQYRVYVKYRYTDMSGPGYYLPNVPYTMYFYQGYAIHGTYWHSNFGTPMSHGCVNFSIPDAEWVFNFSSVGTLVNVHY